MADRSGKREPRGQLSKRRIPRLGYYIIVTDTKETEQNYLYGLRNSIPEQLQGKLVISVSHAKTVNLVDEVLRIASLHAQYGQPWIVFDRDQVKDFDTIISKAQDNGVRVGWSNPCIEIWFDSYFGTMPFYQDSVTCCKGFEKRYQQATSQPYKKSDPSIYEKLCRFGNETQAIEIAKFKSMQHQKNGQSKPSEMCPCTTLHILVEEIKAKFDQY